MTQAPQGPVQKQGNGMAVAGMVLGIVALGLFCFWYLSIPSAIVGLILSVLGGKKAKEVGVGAGMAKAGLICSVIAIGLAILIVILAIVGISMFGSKVQELQQQMQRDAEQSMVIVRSWLA